MALNFKIEPAQGTSIVDLLSDTEVSPEVPLQVPGMKSPERPARSGTPPDIHCSICLEEYNNKCHPDICWHKFCFECLKRWALIESSCPLCKKTFKHICHTVVDECFTERYEVPFVHQTQRRTDEYEQQPRIFLRPFAELSPRFEATSFSSFNLDLYLDLFTRRADGRPNNFGGGNLLSIRDNNFNIGYQGLPDLRIGFRNNPVDNLIATAENVMASIDNAQTMRRRVYQDNMWAEPLPDLSGRFRDCSSTFYRENPAQTYRLYGFILRDITILRSLPQVFMRLRNRVRTSVSEEVLTNMIMRSILTCDIRDIRMIDLLSVYLVGHTEHFLHELYNFAHSPYDLVGYDRNVRYSTSGYALHNTELVDLATGVPPFFNFSQNPIESSNWNLPEDIIDLGSETDDDDDPIFVGISPRDSPEVIEILSSEESDLETLNIVDNTPSDTFSRDQPSTSTGIRDSSIRPNPRYNLRRRRLFQPNFPISPPPNACRLIDRIILDTSSDDEAVETNTRGTQTLRVKSQEALFGKRKRKIKKSKLKKKKMNVVESRPEVQVQNFRARSGSESSSSDDTDTNRFDNLIV